MFHWIYFITIFIIMILASNHITKKREYKTAFKIICFILFLFAGFRYFTGADYNPYLEIFRAVGAMPFLIEDVNNAIVEPTYIWICQISYILDLQFIGVTASIAAFSIYLKYKTIQNYSPYVFVSLLIYFSLYYFFEEYGHIRQGAALAICFFSFRFIIKRKLIPFLICIYIAFFFHKSSVIFILAYFIAPLKINTRLAIILIIVSIFTIPFELYNYIGILTTLTAADSINEGFNTYVDDQTYGQVVEFSILGDAFKLIQLILIFSYDKLIYGKNKTYDYIRTITIFGYILGFVFRGNEIFATRLTVYYMFFIVLTFPLILQQISPAQQRIYKNYLITFMFIFFIRLGLTIERYNLNKFQNVLIDGNFRVE